MHIFRFTSAPGMTVLILSLRHMRVTLGMASVPFSCSASLQEVSLNVSSEELEVFCEAECSRHRVATNYIKQLVASGGDFRAERGKNLETS